MHSCIPGFEVLIDHPQAFFSCKHGYFPLFSE